jgi:hypothetical protein
MARIADHRSWRVQAKSDARLICREVNSRLAQGQQGLLVANAKSAQRKVENVAAHIGIALSDHDTVLIRARAAVAQNQWFPCPRWGQNQK